MKQDCCFCKEYDDYYNSDFYNYLGKKYSINTRVLYSTKNWYAIPSLGCLTTGHILLVSKDHYLCTASIPKQLRNELLLIKDIIDKILFHKTGKKCICFEHGTTSEIFTGANSVDHIHLHIIPVSQSIWPQMSTKYKLNDFEKIHNYEQLFSKWNINLPQTYLFFQDTNHTIYYNENGNQYPSQLFRKCIAPFLNSEQWDWKKEYYEENLLKTIELYK